jgi:hypothetical protein
VEKGDEMTYIRVDGVAVGKKVKKGITVDEKFNTYIDIAEEVGRILDSEVYYRIEKIEGRSKSDGTKVELKIIGSEYLSKIKPEIDKIIVDKFSEGLEEGISHYEFLLFHRYQNIVTEVGLKIKEKFPLFGEEGELLLEFPISVPYETLEKLKNGIHEGYFVKVGKKVYRAKRGKTADVPQKNTECTDFPDIWVEIPKEKKKEKTTNVWERKVVK